MIVIFFDIDGVLNCKRTPNPRKLPYVADPVLVDRFRKLVATTQARAVMSSTWRYDPAGLFSAKRYGIPFDDIVPDLPEQPRGDEIRRWLADHGVAGRFAIIDDGDDELDDLPLFQPSAVTGLTDDVVDAVAAYLAGRTDHDMRSNRVKRFFQNLAAVVRGHKG
jgi:hypothetical protein